MEILKKKIIKITRGISYPLSMMMFTNYFINGNRKRPAALSLIVSVGAEVCCSKKKRG